MIRAVLGNGVVRKVGGALLTLLGVAVVVFVMLRAIPGNQITANLGTEAAALTPAQQEALRSYYGLDQPLVRAVLLLAGQPAHRQPRLLRAQPGQRRSS